MCFKSIYTATSPDARWGVFAILFSVPWALWAFAFSFYSIYKWGATMTPTIWLGLAIFFGILGFVILAFSISLGIYWIKHPRKDVVGGQLTDIKEAIDNFEKQLNDKNNAINNLINEIRQERDERNKETK